MDSASPPSQSSNGLIDQTWWLQRLASSVFKTLTTYWRTPVAGNRIVGHDLPEEPLRLHVGQDAKLENKSALSIHFRDLSTGDDFVSQAASFIVKVLRESPGKSVVECSNRSRGHILRSYLQGFDVTLLFDQAGQEVKLADFQARPATDSVIMLCCSPHTPSGDKCDLTEVQNVFLFGLDTHIRAFRKQIRFLSQGKAVNVYFLFTQRQHNAWDLQEEFAEWSNSHGYGPVTLEAWHFPSHAPRYTASIVPYQRQNVTTLDVDMLTKQEQKRLDAFRQELQAQVKAAR